MEIKLEYVMFHYRETSSLQNVLFIITLLRYKVYGEFCLSGLEQKDFLPMPLRINILIQVPAVWLRVCIFLPAK